MNDDYLAGFIDGEGCFHIGAMGNKRWDGSPYIHCVLQISNTNHKIIDEIRDYIDYGVVGVQTTRSNRKVAYQLQIASKLVLVPLLKRLIPKLRIKRANAELMLEFLSGVRTNGNRRALPPEEYLRREHLMLRSRELNRRGAHAGAL